MTPIFCPHCGKQQPDPTSILTNKESLVKFYQMSCVDCGVKWIESY